MDGISNEFKQFFAIFPKTSGLDLTDPPLAPLIFFAETFLKFIKKVGIRRGVQFIVLFDGLSCAVSPSSGPERNDLTHRASGGSALPLSARQAEHAAVHQEDRPKKQEADHLPQPDCPRC
uniref:hypothetical protein n=1 Tax=Candidatus Electronema sp. TaxID=2698783 RepID=UPI003AA82F18